MKNLIWAMMAFIVLAAASFTPAPAMAEECVNCCRNTPSWASKRRALVKRYEAVIKDLEAKLAVTVNKGLHEALQKEHDALKKQLEELKKELEAEKAKDLLGKPLPKCLGDMGSEIGEINKRIEALEARKLAIRNLVKATVEAAGFKIVEKDKVPDKPVEEPDTVSDGKWDLRAGISIRFFVAIDEGDSPVITVATFGVSREVYPQLRLGGEVELGVINMKVEDGNQTKESHPIIFLGHAHILGDLTDWLQLGAEWVISINAAPFTGEQNQMTQSISAVAIGHWGNFFLKLSAGWVYGNDNPVLFNALPIALGLGYYYEF